MKIGEKRKEGAANVIKPCLFHYFANVQGQFQQLIMFQVKFDMAWQVKLDRGAENESLLAMPILFSSYCHNDLFVSKPRQQTRSIPCIISVDAIKTEGSNLAF